VSGRRLEPDQRREQLLECATRLFGERPYAQVSTADIAAAAGIARGLLHHYFGTKRDLYLEVVRRLVTVPEVDPALLRGSVAARVDAGVTWFLDGVAQHGRTFIAVTGAGGIGDDPEIEAILDAADDTAARQVLVVIGIDPDDRRSRAAIRAYAGLVKATVREWQRGGVLSRADAHLMLRASLLAIAHEVLGVAPAGARV
jgi:AcrR family transcriptional regulator